jgi:phosphatidylglycerophosphate synthase
MLDGAAKALIDPWLTRVGQSLARRGVTANGVTLAALVIGVGAAAAIVQGWFAAGLVLILLSRLCDGLDGAVARSSRPTDFGGYLDIVLDFAFYGMIPLAFVLHDPAVNGLAGAALIFSFYVNGASFLAYAVMAEKRKMTDEEQRGAKSFYFTTGLAEASETLAVFVLFCLWPQGFPLIATLFALICLYTALSRVMLARAAFR